MRVFLRERFCFEYRENKTKTAKSHQNPQTFTSAHYRFPDLFYKKELALFLQIYLKMFYPSAALNGQTFGKVKLK